MTAVDGNGYGEGEGEEEGGHAAGRGGREAVGGGIDIDSEEKKMGKKAKNLSTCFQGNRELLSISLT